MDQHQRFFVTVMLGLSVAALVVPAIVFGLRKLLGSATRGSTTSRILVFSACLISSVWFLRYAVGYCAVIDPETENMTLTWWEEIFNSILHALQTFSMDEDYTQYILDGKTMIADVFGDHASLQTAYGLYASILNIMAPIAGGAIIFDILASIFPRIKLWLADGLFWKEKYYFSELNDASLALAKSICSMKVSIFKRPILVFTDAYVDDEEEKGAESLLEAKAIGAICVRDDLAHVRKNRWGMRKFFLIDKAESGNLRTLADLANSGNSIYLKKAEIYLFTNDDAYVRVEKSVRDKLKADLTLDDSELPVLIPVQSYRNLISNLLVDIPLYEPLVGKAKDENGIQELEVTILGTGHIGTEMFLTTYWIGQMLDCRLKIRVFSQESEKQFWDRIDYINPEIRQTTLSNDPILRYNLTDPPAPIYCEVDYHWCDVKSSDFIKAMTAPKGVLLNSDYVLVALGSDEDNISVADTVRRYIGAHHLKPDAKARTVIAYVVYDAALTEILNREQYTKSDKKTTDICMRAIGSLREVYSVRNVFMGEYEPYAQQVQEAYEAIRDRTDRAAKHNKRMTDDYKYWANLARSMHTKYKVYSMGLIQFSLFDHTDDPEGYRKKLNDALDACNKRIKNPEFQTPEEEAAHLRLLHRLAWLEHRRWNAFTRIKGFRATRDYDAYAKPMIKPAEGEELPEGQETTFYKHMELKLHPCLVECDDRGIRATMSAKGVIDPATVFGCKDPSAWDFLDEVTYHMIEKEFNDYNFKVYDYPAYAIVLKKEEKDVQTESD